MSDMNGKSEEDEAFEYIEQMQKLKDSLVKPERFSISEWELTYIGDLIERDMQSLVTEGYGSPEMMELILCLHKKVERLLNDA